VITSGHNADARARPEAQTVGTVAFASPSLFLITLLVVQWVERLAEMKSVGIEYKPDWAAKAK
jgi:hypothetical protein